MPKDTYYDALDKVMAGADAPVTTPETDTLDTLLSGGQPQAAPAPIKAQNDQVMDTMLAKPEPKIKPVSIKDFNQQQSPLPVDKLAVDPGIVEKVNEIQTALGKPLKISSGFRTPEYNQKLKSQGYKVAEKSTHLQGRAADIPTAGMDRKAVVAAAEKAGLKVEDPYLTPHHIHVELPTEGTPTAVYGETNLLAKKPATFGEKVRSILNKPEDVAKAGNIYAISKLTGKPMGEVSKNYDKLVLDPAITGMLHGPAYEQVLAAAAVPALGEAFITAPIVTAGFIIAAPVINALNPIPKLLKAMPNLRDEIKTPIEAANMIGELYLAGKIGQRTPEALQAMTKRMLTEFNMPKTISVSAAQVKDVFQTGKLTTAEEKSAINALGLSNEQVKAAIKDGVNINIPAEKVTTIMDKPWYSKVKAIFRVPSVPVVKTELAGKPSAGPKALLEAPKEQVSTGIEAVEPINPIEAAPLPPETGIIPAAAPKAVFPQVESPEIPGIAYHFTSTPDKPLSIGSMDSDIGIHFGTENAAKNRGQFKTGQVDKYELTNVNKVLQIEDIGGNHDDPRAVLPMLEKSGGLSPEQLAFLKDSVPKLSGGKVEEYYKLNDEWLKQANRLLTENGYTHARYLNKAEGGESWIALSDQGFKKHVDIIPSQSGVTLIKKVPPKAPAGTIAFNDLIKSNKIDNNAVYELLKEKALMRWKKTKGLQTTDFNTKINSIIDQAYTHLPNRNWNPKTQPSIESWLDSAADSAVKVAINELSHPSGNAEIRKDVAELTAFMDKIQAETGTMPALQDIVGPKEEPTELTKKWGPTKVVRIYLEKMASEQGISYEHLTETFEIGTETGIEYNAGIAIPMVKFPSVEEMAANTRELCAYTKESWQRISDPLRFFPQLKNYPDFKNSIRVDFIGANVEAKMWVDKLYGGIFGHLDAKAQGLAIEILKYRSQIERIRKGRISPVTMDEASALLLTATRLATPEVLLATEKWNALEKTMQQDLIARGKLDPEQAMEDHVAFYVDAYTKDWMLWSSVPRRLKRPFRGYLRYARGTTKQYRVDMDTLLASMYRIRMDNALEDFTLKWLNKLDVTNSMSLEDKMQIFGATTANFGQTLTSKMPRPGAVYDIGGKKYIGYQFEHFPRTMFKTEEGLIALGRLHKTYVIPEDVVEVFKNFKPVSDPFVGALMFQVNRMNSFFKSTAIFSIFPKYNVNNFVGDAYMLYMQSPKSFLKLDPALKYLVKDPRKYTPEEKVFTDWMKEQRVLSTFAEAELAHFKNNPLNLLAWSNKASEFREKILRTCLAMRLWEAMRSGRSLAPKFDWIPTEGLNVREANGKIAREVLVDYLATSNTFNRYMKGAAIPFGTWFAKASGLLFNLLKKHPFKTLISMLAPVVAVDMYNNSGDRKKTEDNLPEYIRNRTHVVLKASNRPGRAWVLVPQLPIDCLPIFPMVNIGVKNAFKLFHGEIGSAKEAAQETLKETATASIRIGEFLLTPLYRFFSGIKSNKDPVTQQMIVPRDGKVGPEIWIPRMTTFAANTLIPPMSLALRAEKKLEYSETDNLGDAARRWFMEWWDPVRALGFVEASLTGKVEHFLESADKATRKYNNIMVRYAEDISERKQKEPAYYVDLAKESGLVKSTADEQNFMSGLLNVAKNPQWRIFNLQEKLRTTEDPDQRVLIEKQILWMQNYRKRELLKATPKGARGDALREFTNR